MSVTGRPERGRVARRRPRTLRAHLLRLTLTVLVPALVAGGLTAWQLSQAYRRAIEISLQGGARAMSVAVDREVEIVVTALSSLAASSAATTFALTTAAPPGDEPLAKLYERARGVGAAFGGWVAFSQADGRQIFNTQHPLGTELPAADGLPWIQRAIASGEPVVSNLFAGDEARHLVLAAVVPVMLAGRQAPGAPAQVALLLAFEPARLAALLARVAQGEVAGLIQVDDGIIVARSVGHSAVLGVRAPGWVTGPLRERLDGLAAGPSLEGKPLVAAFQRLDRVPWSVVVTAPEDVYEAAWRRPVARLAAGGATLLAVGLTLAAVQARQLIRPVQALAHEADAIAAGLLPPDASPPTSVAELEALRQALSRSTEALRARAAAEGRAAAAAEAAAALRAERDRALLYFDVARAVLVVLGPDGRVRGINREGLNVLGLAGEDEAVGRDWFEDFVPRPLREPIWALFKAVSAGHEPQPGAYESPVLRADGAVRLVGWRNAALRDATGDLIAVVASGEDITERRAAEERQTLLLHEVDHRTKNALAVVQALIRLTRVDGAPDHIAALEGRVNALARAHTLLAREGWAGVELRELIETELAAYSGDGRVRLAGPPMRLIPTAVPPLSLVLHELTVNAAQHGSLSGAEGALDVTWTVAPGAGLRLQWSEVSGPSPFSSVEPPTRRGFGLRMIVATVAGQLGGTVSFEWRPAGLRCEIVIGTAQAGADEKAAPG